MSLHYIVKGYDQKLHVVSPTRFIYQRFTGLVVPTEGMDALGEMHSISSFNTIRCIELREDSEWEKEMDREFGVG